MNDDAGLQVVEADDRSARNLEFGYLFEDLSEKDRVWIAWRGTDAIGGLRLTLETGPTGRDLIGPGVTVHTVSVHAPYQRQGAGRALMVFAESWLRTNRDLPQTLSLAVEVGNDPAIHLYSELDYEFVSTAGQRILTPDQRCFVMVKTIV